MLSPFRYVSCKNVDTLVNISRHYARVRTKPKFDKTEVFVNDAKPKKDRVPIIKCKKSMYDFYQDDTFNKYKPVLASHGWDNRKTKDDHFFIYPYKSAGFENDETIEFETFNDFGFNPTLCKNLENMDLIKPLNIQNLGIPKLYEGHNVLIAAETGCGKTLAYLLPMIEKLLEWKQRVDRDINCPLALIVTPSRELTVQIALELIKLSKDLNIKTKIITGGRTKKMLMNPPVGDVDVLVCSFGVLSKLTTFRVYNLSFVRYMVLDEADSLFHSTFSEKLRVFMRRISVGFSTGATKNAFPGTAQLVLASATIPSRLDEVLHGIVHPDSLQRVTTEKLHSILVPQKFIRLIPSQKPSELLKFVKPKALQKQRVIVFTNRNGTSYWLACFLRECGVSVVNLHGDMSLEVRRGKYGEFLNGKAMVLSTTNGGSRGLDTLMVNHILNYDFPLDTADYVHRCGRTGRVGTVGDSRVTNFISRPGEIAVVKKIEMAARRRRPIPIFNLVETDEAKMEAEDQNDQYVEKLIENLDEPDSVPY
ncbi:probable ATP-dependent RNA helicase DDX28 [Ceratina calcarata]|uniref:Probable ATP-dependent RNA helicase DDX28 n=1 Tax=Ceratina calcarata TaxID=156304 RepID=A0AAJ7J1D0_9HYME|nr:probable ATP-dependent RNA helicase DDX28 [Ceratina calcarata]XP_026670152.1 probable ATP-dependent RNA helicase DDX28 [Ceratina calcarata]